MVKRRDGVKAQLYSGLWEESSSLHNSYCGTNYDLILCDSAWFQETGAYRVRDRVNPVLHVIHLGFHLIHRGIEYTQEINV